MSEKERTNMAVKNIGAKTRVLQGAEAITKAMAEDQEFITKVIGTPRGMGTAHFLDEVKSDPVLGRNSARCMPSQSMLKQSQRIC